ARKACRARPDLFGPDVPANPPWDPIPAPRGAVLPASEVPHVGTRAPAAPTVEARRLQASSVRRIWSTLLDYRDWTSYVYVPLLVPTLILLPYSVRESSRKPYRLNHLISSLSQGSRDLEKMTELLERKPMTWTGETPEKARKLDLEPADLKGFEILQ